MDDFVVTKDRRKRPISSMEAENQEYTLSWFYDGDYMADIAAGTLRREGIVVHVTPKKNNYLGLQYVPVNEDPVIQVNAASVSSSDIEALKNALDAAKEAAQKTVKFMRQYV